MACKKAVFGNDFNLDETGQTNLSELSFPSHVSGLESFSDFEKTTTDFQEECSPKENDGTETSMTKMSKQVESKENNEKQNMDPLHLNLPSTFDAISPSSLNSTSSDAMHLSGNDMFDLHTPSTDRGQMVFEFLTQDRQPRQMQESANSNLADAVFEDSSNKDNLEPVKAQGKGDNERFIMFDEKQGQASTSKIDRKNLDLADFELGIGINQRPGLDGSSSDSDDGAAMNFARSRIGTINQQHLANFLDERQPEDNLDILEERQLAEGDDVFSRDVPGDGGGGGDGSSGHSDSDVDGDGGVAIRVRSRGTQRNRMRATATIQPLSQQNENLPERERPVGDSVPAMSQQWRNQNPPDNRGDADDAQYLSTATPRSENLLTPNDLDSSQDSRLSARFFIASATPGMVERQNSAPQSNWMEDNTTMFRFSESAPATPGRDVTPEMPLFNSDAQVFDSSSADRNVVGDDNDADETIIDASSSLSLEITETPKLLGKGGVHCDSSFGIPTSTDNGGQDFTNPIERSSDASLDPFSSFAYNKNPFDTLDMTDNNRNAFSFSGFGEQNESEIGDSGFKLNSQDADALFDEDEKSFQHSNTISKLANISQGSDWDLEGSNDKGGVRLSKYFNAMSEDMGTFSSDRPDRPRPNFDDYKVVKTPPALDRPAVLYRASQNSSTASTQSFSFDTTAQSVSKSIIDAEKKPNQNQSGSNLASTFALSRPVLDKELASLSEPLVDIGNKGDEAFRETLKGKEEIITMPETNDEAESLLHDIGVGRVSLRGISGVNISNLAAKIAVATNSDPKFILKLLISLIEGEKKEVAGNENTCNTKRSSFVQNDNTLIKTKEAPSDGPNQARNKNWNQQESQNASGFMSLKPPLPRTNHKKRNALESDEQSSLKLADLDDSIAPVKLDAHSSQSRVPQNTILSSQDGQNVSNEKEDMLLDLPEGESTKPVVSASSHSAIWRSLHSSKTDQRQNTKPTEKLQTSHTRPISSVMPLVTPRENRALYRDSGVQCHERVTNDTAQPVECGASFERSARTATSRNVSTADAAVQWEGPEAHQDFPADAERINYLSHIAKKTPGGSNSTAQSSLRSTGARQLSSTTIDIGESEDSLSKCLTLSPVVAEPESIFSAPQNDKWKPLQVSKRAISASKSATVTTEGPIPKSIAPSSAVKSLKMSGEQIHDILPRVSDIRVRESNATFYPLVASNQTMVGRPSVAVQEQKAAEQQKYAPHRHLQPQELNCNLLKENKEQASSELFSKKTSMPTIQIIVPTELCFAEVQCIGVAVNQCLPIHNPSSRWIQCLIEIAFYSVNGSQADASSSCAFSMQPKVFIAPHTTEDVKVTFLADYAGVYMAKLNLIASPVVTDDSILSEDEMFPNDVHLEGIAELPNIEVFQDKDGIIDFGEMPGGINRTRSIKLLNKGRADVPLKLVLSGNSSKFQCFEFVDSEFAPIGSSIQSKPHKTEELPSPVLSVLLPGGQQLGKTFEPHVVQILFKAPELKDRGFPAKLGPPNEFTARVDIEIDSKGNGIIVGSLLLKAFVGIARLHAPRSLQAISLSAPEGQRVSRGIPFRNAGNISLEIRLQVSAFTDLFSVVPDQVILAPGQSTEVFVHFLSASSITIESFLLVSVHPDGPQYEVVIRGTATAPKPVKEKEETPVLLCNKPVLCWAGIPIGRSMQQRAYLRNNSLKQDLQMTISVEGHHSDFQVQNTFDFKEKGENHHEVTLKPQSEVPVHVLFVPSTFGMISSTLVIRPAGEGPKFKIPLHGYGGCSKLQLTNAQKVGENYWIDAGEISTGKQNIINLSLQNVGNRAAFVKIVSYEDVSKRKLYPSSHISIAPNDFVLLEKCTKQLVIVLQPTESVLQNANDKPFAAASLAIFSGDESIRQLYRKSNVVSNRKAIEKEGPMQNLVFDAPFMDENKVMNDIKYPDIPHWESFFLSTITRNIVSLVGRPSTMQQPSTPSSTRPMGLDPNDLVIHQTPARALPPDAAVPGDRKDDASVFGSDSGKPKETWEVTPDHIVLSAPNTDKSNASIQMINYSEKPLSFEFSWPAESLIITPSKDNVPPRSQLIVVVSPKPSFLSTGGELPWRGCIYVQCEGIQKCVRVQIREDLALDRSPFTGMAQRLAPLNPSNTPYRTKQPIKLKSLISVEPTSVVFPVTNVNRFQESFVKIESNSSATLKWVLSSIAPPYFKDMTESGDIFRTTYTAFRFARHSGTLQPKETNTIQVTFQPRDYGEYSQFWDLQVAVEATGETGKSRIELRGKGIFTETNQAKEDGKLVGRAHPILKPAPEPEYLNIVKRKEPEKEAEGTATTKIEKKNRGVFVKDDPLNFKTTKKGETVEMQFRLCNDTKEVQKVRISGAKPPFSVNYSKLLVNAKSFIRVPVFFAPTELNMRSEGLLEVVCLSGAAKTHFVKLVGISQAK